MVGYSYYAEGPMIEVRFDTAAGIEAEKTRIRTRDVDVGLVESVRLSRISKTSSCRGRSSSCHREPEIPDNGSFAGWMISQSPRPAHPACT
jgi:hypothetical protein